MLRFRGIIFILLIFVMAVMAISIPQINFNLWGYDFKRGEEGSFLGLSLGFIIFFDIFFSFISFSRIGFFKGTIFKSSAKDKVNPIKINMIIFTNNVIFWTIKNLINESINYVISIYV